jgi:serine/threonine-protein kinase
VSTDLETAEAAGVRAGDVLAGKYRVDKVLGVGGMGVVVAAYHLQLEERVAIKLLRQEAIATPEAVARFDREARAAVKIKSEHVARITDVGRLETGAPFMVMEYLEGTDLSGWLTRHGRLPIEQAVEFVLQACEAIAEAHALGIVHRDLKPANLFCIRRPDGALSIKVLDFGISKLTAPGQSGAMAMTRTQAVMGSPLYMSPEQLESSKGVDARADVWALGIILYELITGQVPFQSDMLTELVIRIVANTPQPPRAMRPDTPPGLEAVILRCLEKDRERRFPNVAELARALVDFGGPKGWLSLERIQGLMQAGPSRAPFISSPGVGGGQPPTPMPATMPVQMPAPVPTQPYAMTPASWGQPPAPQPRRGPVIALVAVLGLLLAGGIAVAVVMGHTTGTHASTASSAPPAASTETTASTAEPAAAPTPAVTLAPVASASAPASAAATVDPPASAGAPAPSAAAATAPAASIAAKPAFGAPFRGGPARAVPTAAPAKKDCDPPYFVDAAGHRQYKKECF